MDSIDLLTPFQMFAGLSPVVGLRLILGVYSPLSIAAMRPGSLVGLRWAMDPSDR
jgi:hypothetical protein